MEKNKNAPATACKNAKTSVTVLVGNLPKISAPTAPPAVTPIAVGMSTEKSYIPCIKYSKNEKKETGKITKIAVACASFCV